ncbi:MAG: hypothetical protein M3619_14875 [Myxococcota bacterium]|nr:hypothetical protein [Myxococcota bacterium]
MRCDGRVLVTTTMLVTACGGGQIQERSAVDLTKHLPASFEIERPREGDARTVKVRVWVDAAIRALPRWKDDIGDHIDYANQVLTPLAGVRLAIEGFKDWNRTGEPHQALQALAAEDKGDGVTWVLGYILPPDTATKAMGELVYAEPLGKHVIVRGWGERPEATVLAGSLPDLKDGERIEVLAAHRRHKQAVVLLNGLATTLGAIAETDPAWIKHPSYSVKQSGFSERSRELITLALDARQAEETEQVIAKKLLAAIEKSEWGGWIQADRDQVTARMRNLLDAARAGKTAADVPPAAYDQYTRIKAIAGRGDTVNALAELDNLLSAYPGNAAIHQLRCEIMLGKPGIADKATRTACTRASELAPGDPTPHLAVGTALVKIGDIKAARAELVQAEGKIGNLPAGKEDAWRKLIATYQGMGMLTWTEEAIAKAKLDDDPVAAQIGQVRARYGIPRSTKLVAPTDEALLVAAIRAALDQVYASKYGEAEKTLDAADKKWPGAPGLAAARCDLALRVGQIGAARAACQRALAGDPNASWALYLSGVIALRDASGTRAGIEKLKQAIRIDPELGQAWRTLAKAYDRAKDKAALDQLARDYQAKFGQPLPR